MKTEWKERLLTLLFSAILISTFSSCIMLNFADTKSKRNKKEILHYILLDFAGEHSAASDWEEQLGTFPDEKRKRLFTLEFERVWIRNKPILFTGNISDISSINTTHYQVIFDHKSIHDNKYLNEIRLTLTCSKSIIDSLLDSHKEVLDTMHQENAVAIIASVTKVSTTTQSVLEDEISVTTGEGILTDVIFIGKLYK